MRNGRTLSKKWLRGELDHFDARILKALYGLYPTGCGYNQLGGRARVNKKVLDLRLANNKNSRSLVYRKLVNVEKGRAQNSPWNITLTENGRKKYLIHVRGKIEDAVELFLGLSEERMREAVREVMTRVFTDLFDLKHGGNLPQLDMFLSALEEPYMDVANKPLHGIQRDNSGLPYYHARFTGDRLPWWWIRDDAILALKKGHWLSRGRIRLLAILGLGTEISLRSHNDRWASSLVKAGSNLETKKDKEYEEREPIIRRQHQEAFKPETETPWNRWKYI